MLKPRLLRSDEFPYRPLRGTRLDRRTGNHYFEAAKLRIAPLMLEALSRDDKPLSSAALIYELGYSHSIVSGTFALLHKAGMAACADRGVYQLTERGKIALAIWRGKQHRIRGKRRMAA